MTTNENMQDMIKDIAFNPCGYTVSDIREKVSGGEVTRTQLQGVFGNDVVEKILDGELVPPLPSGSANEAAMGKMGDATQVVFWGMPKSGKTLVIASLLSLKGMKLQANGMSDRINRMKGLFANKGLQQVPHDSSCKVDYPVVYRTHLMGKSYPLVITEATIPENGDVDVDKYVSGDKMLIHVFCIDCRQDIRKQESRLLELMGKLGGCLNRTDGIYALVTKTDLMNAPAAYKENAAQTLVTKGMPRLWCSIQNVCFEKQIFNVLPIPFSTGRFVVRDLASLDAGDAEALFHDALLPKCQPRRSMMGKILSMGKWWQAALCAVFLACVIIWGGYKAYKVLTAPPTTPMLPYDYRAAFLEEEKDLPWMNFTKASSLYDKKRKDLNVERALFQASGETVLTAEDLRVCDSALTNDYAKVVSAKCDNLLASSHWSEDEKILQQLLSRTKELLAHQDVLIRDDVNDYHTALDDYFKQVKPLIVKSQNCKSIKDVDFVESKDGQEWLKYPYDNEINLKEGLRMATVNAYENCAKYFQDRIDTIAEKYPKPLWSFAYDDNANKRIELMTPYEYDVDSLLERLDGKGDAFDKARSILRATRKKIESNTNEPWFN